MDPVIQFYDIEFKRGVCHLGYHAFYPLVSLCHHNLGSGFKHAFSPLQIRVHFLRKLGYSSSMSVENGRCKSGSTGAQRRGTILGMDAVYHPRVYIAQVFSPVKVSLAEGFPL